MDVVLKTVLDMIKESKDSKEIIFFQVSDWKLPSMEFNKVLGPHLGVCHKRQPMGANAPTWAGGKKPPLPPAALAVTQGTLSIRN